MVTIPVARTRPGAGRRRLSAALLDGEVHLTMERSVDKASAPLFPANLSKG